MIKLSICDILTAAIPASFLILVDYMLRIGTCTTEQETEP